MPRTRVGPGVLREGRGEAGGCGWEAPGAGAPSSPHPPAPWCQPLVLQSGSHSPARPHLLFPFSQQGGEQGLSFPGSKQGLTRGVREVCVWEPCPLKTHRLCSLRPAGSRAQREAAVAPADRCPQAMGVRGFPRSSFCLKGPGLEKPRSQVHVSDSRNKEGVRSRTARWLPRPS